MSKHPFEPPAWQQQRFTASSRSKEAPMDYEYTTSSSKLDEPPRKRPHQLEPMEWEPETTHKTDLWGGMGSTKPPGGTFLFQPPAGMDFDPTPHTKDDAKDNSNDGHAVNEVGEMALIKVSENGIKHERKRRTQSRRRRQENLDDDSGDSSSDDDRSPIARRIGGGSRHTHHHLSLYGQPNSYGPSSPPGLRHDTPYILLKYVDLCFRAILGVVGLYIVSAFLFAFTRDVTEKAHGYSTEIRQEILHCAAQYQQNRCHPPEQRTSFTEAACQGWEHCMNRDPEGGVGRLKVAAEALGDVVEGFVGGLSWRTAAFLLALVTISAMTLRSTSKALDHAANSHPHVPPTRSALPIWPAHSSSFPHAAAYDPHVLSNVAWQPGMPLSFGAPVDEPDRVSETQNKQKLSRSWWG